LLQGNIVAERIFYSITTIDLPLGGTISCLFNNSGTRKDITAVAFSGAAASPVDAASTIAQNTSTTVSAGPTGTLACPSTSGNCEVIIVGLGWDSNNTAFTTEAAGFTNLGLQSFDQSTAIKLVTANTAITYTPTVTASSRSWNVALVGFEAATGGVTPTNRLLMRGAP
jgi:hypothetical protein